MLRKTSGRDSAGGTLGAEEDGEKDAKIRKERHQRSQLKTAMIFLGIVCMVVFSIVKLNNTKKYAPALLRSRSSEKMKSLEREMIDPGRFLPPNSIYKLSVEDINGQMVNLEKYRDMVTLVVNVACK